MIKPYNQTARATAEVASKMSAVDTYTPSAKDKSVKSSIPWIIVNLASPREWTNSAFKQSIKSKGISSMSMILKPVANETFCNTTQSSFANNPLVRLWNSNTTAAFLLTRAVNNSVNIGTITIGPNTSMVFCKEAELSCCQVTWPQIKSSRCLSHLRVQPKISERKLSMTTIIRPKSNGT